MIGLILPRHTCGRPCGQLPTTPNAWTDATRPFIFVAIQTGLHVPCKRPATSSPAASEEIVS
jgi:hypothetical protein